MKRTQSEEDELWAQVIEIMNRARADEEASRIPEADETPAEPLSRLAQIKKSFRIAVPHVALIGSLMTYLSIGAFVFILIENDFELETRKQKMENITRIRKSIVEMAVASCPKLTGNTQEDLLIIKNKLLPLLHSMSWAHEYKDKYHQDNQMWAFHEKDMPELWTFPTSVFYALTVATSTGYERVSPHTNTGRIFTVCFGLLGIPLLFITAADIGKFMSEMVTKSYGHIFHQYQRIRFGTQQTGTVNAEDEEVQLPFWAYFLLILGYCACGSLMLNTIEKGTLWNFIYGFFFGFNAITTIGVGDIDGRNTWYMCLIVAYVIIGLAVITMCIDLASSQVKVLFTKLHYFGRQFRGARLALSGEIQEMLHLIAAMKYKNDVTLDDIITFLTVQEKLNRRPYIPRNVYFLKWIEDEPAIVHKYRTLSLDTIAGGTNNTNRALSTMEGTFSRRPSTISEEPSFPDMDNEEGPSFPDMDNEEGPSFPDMDNEEGPSFPDMDNEEEPSFPDMDNEEQQN